MALFPTRVVELPGGGTAYTFTMFQSPEMPDELFAHSTRRCSGSSETSRPYSQRERRRSSSSVTSASCASSGAAPGSRANSSRSAST